MKRAPVIWFCVVVLVAVGCSSPADDIESLQRIQAYQTHGWTGAVYIGADGSVDPPGAPIITADNVTYSLTDNISTTG